MKFSFEYKSSDSPLVDGIWRTEGMGGSFISVAESNSGLVITRQRDKITLTVRGPETLASTAPVPEDAEIFGIVFKLGTFMPSLPLSKLVDRPINLPEAGSQSFWLHGSAWQFPDFENIDTFITRLVREGLLVSDPVIDTVLQDQSPYLSSRTVQRRFLQATGLTYNTIQQIKRAQLAMSFLQQGKSILDTVAEAGYFDQPHLTRSLKHYVGQTPAQLIRSNQSE
ncbi:MAG: helix-turn-helix transcriptional regulator [Anaerolineae bacterium]|nr:helix-turn-helix transcriptional regulator [Anaerolineae bacterium]